MRALVALLALLSACRSASPAAYALNALAEVVDPAWSLAEDACIQSQHLVAARETAGLAKPAETDAALKAIRVRCDEVTSAFERIRAQHLEAGALLRNGDTARADALLRDIIAQWRALQGGTQ